MSESSQPDERAPCVGSGDLFGVLVAKRGFSFIPWRELRSCPCRKCGKKMLMYANHPHAFGWKDLQEDRFTRFGELSEQENQKWQEWLLPIGESV